LSERARVPRPSAFKSSIVISLALPSGPIVKVIDDSHPGVSTKGA
jgi:hypothetical protein